MPLHGTDFLWLYKMWHKKIFLSKFPSFPNRYPNFAVGDEVFDHINMWLMWYCQKIIVGKCFGRLAVMRFVFRFYFLIKFGENTTPNPNWMPNVGCIEPQNAIRINEKDSSVNKL